jgi:hypothetical protein
LQCAAREATAGLNDYHLETSYDCGSQIHVYTGRSFNINHSEEPS